MASVHTQKLNKIQLNRLQVKLESIIRDKRTKWLDKNPEPQPMTRKEQLEAIKSGKAKLKPLSEIHEDNFRYLYVKDAFVFPAEAEFKKLEKKHTEAKNRYAEKLEHEAERIMDQAIFISCEAALEMIQKFETFEP